MENLIIRELEFWQNDPQNYLNRELYKKGYNHECPPLQIISNWNSDTKNQEKLLVLGLEPHLNSQSFQTQMEWLFNDNNDVNRENYMKWQLEYFSNVTHFGGDILQQPYWRSVKKYIQGFFDLDALTDNDLGNYCIAMDVIPMHSVNHAFNVNDDAIRSLFIERLNIVGSKNVLFLSGNRGYRKMLESLFNQQAEILDCQDGVPSYLIDVQERDLALKIFIRPQPAAAIQGNSYYNMVRFGEYIRTL